MLLFVLSYSFYVCPTLFMYPHVCGVKLCLDLDVL